MNSASSMSPELTKAVKIVLKYEIQALLSRLAETGEESVVIMASGDEGTYGHLGSSRGKDFLQGPRLDIKKDFLSFCTDSSTDHIEAPEPSKLDFQRSFRPHRRKSIPRCKSEPRNVEFEKKSIGRSPVDRIPESSLEESVVDQIPKVSFCSVVDQIPIQVEPTALDLSGHLMPEVNGDSKNISSLSLQSDVNSDIDIPPQTAEYSWREEKFDIKQEYFETLPEQSTIDRNVVLQNSDLVSKCTNSRNILESLDVLSKNKMTFVFKDFPKSQPGMSVNRQKLKAKRSPRKIKTEDGNSSPISRGIADILDNATQNSEVSETHDNFEVKSEISESSVHNNSEDTSDQFQTEIGDTDQQISMEEKLFFPEQNNAAEKKLNTKFSQNKRTRKSLPTDSGSSTLDTIKSPTMSDMKGAFVEMGHMARCLLCNKILQKNNRTFHWRSHVGDKRYKCDICNKAFTHPSNMRSHRKIHSDEKPFKCYLCERAYRRRDYLLQHLEKFHQRVMEQQWDQHSQVDPENIEHNVMVEQFTNQAPAVT